MQSTSIRAFKALSSKIHPQLPLSPRESQQLLGLLTTSFRRHLDQEYPAGQLRGGQNAMLVESSKPVARSTASAHPSSYTTATHHLESILTNPMFTTRPRRRSGSTSRTSSSQRQATETRQKLKNPLQWFEEQVAAGTATIAGATLCLESLRASACQDTTTLNRILALIRSVGLQRSEAFYTHQPFLRTLASALVADGQQQALWNLLNVDPRSIIEGTMLSHHDVSLWRARLLKYFVRAELNQPNSQDYAIALILAASSSGRFSAQEVNLAMKIFTEYMESHPFAASLKDFDALLASSRRWSAELNNSYHARLSLLHPQQPSAQPGLEYLRRRDLSPEAVREMKPSRRRSLIQLSLNVARLLLAQERFEDGAWVLEFVRDKFSQELDLSKENHSATAMSDKAREKELHNLRLLDGLALE